MKKSWLSSLKKFAPRCDWVRPPHAALCLAALAATVSAQTLPGLPTAKPPSSTPTAPLDALNRTSPRSAILAFLEACHAERYTLAARYLDLRKIPAAERATQGPELARQLAGILDQDPSFEVDNLSADSTGNLSDGLPPDLETLVALNEGGEAATLQLQRIQQRGVPVWLVAADSVARLPDLAALAGASEIGKRMPKFLVRHTLLGTPLWAWLALLALTLALFALSRLLSRLFLAMLKPLAGRFAKSLENYRWETLTDPLRLLISLAVFRALMELVTPSALLRDYLNKLLVFLSTLGLAALAMRIVDLASARVQSRLGSAERALTASLLPLGLRVVRIGIFLLAGLLVLAAWGYNTNALLAGLGVGGLAVALAAQKTIENLFGAVALISDRPVLVGDYCQFGSQAGTVEDIGLRSTRIRTNDRTMVTIPNSSFSTMTIENLSRRDRMWFHPTLRLRRDTATEKVTAMLEAVSELLHAHPLVEPGEVPVRFTKITDYSLDLEIFAYVSTADFDQYLKVQTELLLKLLEVSRRHGVALAVPVAESLNVSAPSANV